MTSTDAASKLAAPSFRHLVRAGTGGSADVFRAVNEAGSPVALKVARSSEGTAALAREAFHAALALSPRLPELLDVGWILLDGDTARVVPAETANARAFLALRWAPGKPLDPGSLSRSKAADRTALALRVAAHAGEALADLHAAGLAHGDVKPDNLLIGEGGAVHLLDLGLAGPVHAVAVEGATLRYLARGDADLGDARARDLIALGTVLAEIADPAVAAAADPILAARGASLPPAVAALSTALLAPSPGARPGAGWVAAMARAARGAGERGLDERSDHDARQVRATYLRLRRVEIEQASGVVGEDVAPWLAEAIAWSERVRALRGELERGIDLGPLAVEDRGRWLVALVGSPAAAWPSGSLAAVPERSLAEALTALARRSSPAAWTWREVEDAVLGHAPAPAGPPRRAPGARRAHGRGEGGEPRDRHRAGAAGSPGDRCR